MSKEAPWKVAISTNMGKMAIVPKICQRLSENSMRCLQGPFISGDFDENGKCRENLAESPLTSLRAFSDILGARKAQENPRSFFFNTKKRLFTAHLKIVATHTSSFSSSKKERIF